MDWLRSSAWIWLFSFTHNAGARSGGALCKHHHIANRGDKVPVGRQLEGLQPVRLQTERRPDALQGRDGQTARAPCYGNSNASHQAGALQRMCDQLFDPLIVDRARRPRTRLVTQASDQLIEEKTAPFPHRPRVARQRCRDLSVLRAGSARQHDTRPQSQPLCRHPTGSQPAEFSPLRLAQFNQRMPTIRDRRLVPVQTSVAKSART